MKLRSLHTSATLAFYIPDFSSEMELQFFDVGISAGFPSPADDFIELSIDQKKGKNKIKFARQSLCRQWKMKQEKLSYSYTTKISVFYKRERGTSMNCPFVINPSN